ncbi:3-methyladenine DNA glycosylase [Longibacter salinarum]|uniref:DNA-3-methyladenine glycosylase II n=1 Tax=Longibacter salinarum TaxID=1850348 RepID=A0A2A8CUG0_9BACT|nr:DNA-3-methyladenine glycosylase [Longibacter salinarum]PEN11475.1 3-methyladenine DNA glycosylase [Longibacter salinarum]
MHDPFDDDILQAHVDDVWATNGPLALEAADDPFERLVTSIVNQQLSVASARTIRNRLFETCDITPQALLQAEPERLRNCGLSRQKTEYVRNVAEAFLQHEWTRASFADLNDEMVIDALTDIRGVGIWTAKMFLMFALGRPDVFPVEDLGIRNGMTTLYGESDRSRMREIADSWRPRRSLASLYLWRAAG